MGYAIRNDGLGWRTVAGPEKVLEGETYSEDQPPPIDISWQKYQAEAQALLEKSDVVAMRCFKADVPFPDDWRTYVHALREIMRAPTGDHTMPFPTMPPRPPGT